MSQVNKQNTRPQNNTTLQNHNIHSPTPLCSHSLSNMLSPSTCIIPSYMHYFFVNMKVIFYLDKGFVFARVWNDQAKRFVPRISSGNTNQIRNFYWLQQKPYMYIWNVIAPSQRHNQQRLSLHYNFMNGKYVR
jgi:hypothetical protein